MYGQEEEEEKRESGLVSARQEEAGPPQEERNHPVRHHGLGLQRLRLREREPVGRPTWGCSCFSLLSRPCPAAGLAPAREEHSLTAPVSLGLNLSSYFRYFP